VNAVSAVERKGKVTGFEGLITLVSDGDVEVAEIRQVLVHSRSNGQSADRRVRKRAPFGQRLGRALRAMMADSRSRRAVVVVGLVLVIACAVIYFNLTSPGGQSVRQASPSQPATSAAAIPAPATTPSPTPFSASVAAESAPPQGTDLMLDEGQLHYCLSEKVRLDAAQGELTAASEYAVTQFNLSVDDYNSRCARFRYHQRTWDTVQSTVDAEQASLNAQGRQRAREWLANDPRRAIPQQSAAAHRHASVSIATDSRTAGTPRIDSRVRAKSDLSSDERDSLESACLRDKTLNGPAAYRSCAAHQIAMLSEHPNHLSLDGLSSDERDSLESVCLRDKVLNGPAAYDRCLAKDLTELNQLGRGSR
jgi:hypothetical protein